MRRPSRGMRAVYSLIETVIRNIGGGFGQKIRYAYYRRRFHACGRNVRIDEGVIFQNPESIIVGDDVWFLQYSIITGRGTVPISADRIVVERGSPSGTATVSSGDDVFLEIGSKTSIGAYNIVHGYGGLFIGNRVTTSARVSIYSFSHIPFDPNDRSRITFANSMVDDRPVACIASPITLQDGVWLGLGATVFGGVIGANTFVEANAIVMGDLPANSVAGGSPAKWIENRFTSPTEAPSHLKPGSGTE